MSAEQDANWIGEFEEYLAEVSDGPVLMQVAEARQLVGRIHALEAESKRHSHSTAHALKMRLRERNEELAVAKLEVAKLEASAKESARNTAALETSIDRWRERAEEAEAENERLAAEVERLQGADKTLEACEDSHLEVEVERDRWRERAEEAEAENERLAAEVAHLGRVSRVPNFGVVARSVYNELLDERDTLKAENERLEEECERRRNRAKAAEADRDRARARAEAWKVAALAHIDMKSKERWDGVYQTSELKALHDAERGFREAIGAARKLEGD